MDSSGKMDYLTDLVATGEITTEVYERLLHLEKEKAKKEKADESKELVAVDKDDDADSPEVIPKMITSNNQPTTDPFRQKVGKYDPTKPMAATFRSLPPTGRLPGSSPGTTPVSHKPPVEGKDGVKTQGPRVNTKKGRVNKPQGAQAKTITAPKGGTATEGKLIDITEENPQSGAPLVDTKKESAPLQGLALRLKGLEVGSRKSGASIKGTASPTKNPAAQVPGAGSNIKGTAPPTKNPVAQVPGATSRKAVAPTTKQPVTQAQRPSKAPKESGQNSDQSERQHAQQETRLKVLGLTSEEALRFACPWDMYLQHDGKRCTDISCPFNHTSSGDLEYKPLMCPFWGGQGGRHARCTKPANVCKLAHFACGHKQYGALPPGWVVRK